MATAATKKPKPAASKKPAPAAATPTPAGSKKPAPAAATELTCPGCGKTFTRPAALGAHRQRAHGIAGTSQNARSRRTPQRGTTARTTARAATRASNSASRGVDHDALLRTLFPAGIPPRQDIIAAVNDWLSQADTLARQH
jgi:Zinc finger, C2H2 type